MQTASGLVGHTLPHARSRAHASTLGWVALTSMIIAGSTTAAFAKELTGYFSPLSMIFLSELMMLIFAVLSFGFIPILRKTIRLKSSTILPMVTAGVMNGVLAPLFWFWGLTQTTAVNAQLFGMAEMLFLIVFGALYAHQSLKRAHGIGGLVMICGIMIVSLKGFSEPFAFAIGDLGIVIACFFYALGGAIVCAHLKNVAPQIIIFVRSLCAVAFFFLLSPFIQQPFITEMRHFPVAMIAVLLSYGLISRFLLIFSYYESLKRLPISTVSLLSPLSVAGAMLFAWMYLGETITWYHIAGAAFVIAGAGVVQWTSVYRLEERFMHFVKAHHRQQM